MNLRFGRTLALAALVGAALPAAGRAAEGGGPVLGIATPKAVTAPTLLDQNWGTHDAAEVMISDADSQPAASAATGAVASGGVPSAVPNIGWRSPRKATSEGGIQFTQPASASAAAAAKPTAAPSASSNGSLDFDAKLSDAALAAKAYAEELSAQAAKAEAENAAAKHSAAEQAAAEAKAAIAKAAIEKAAMDKAAIEQGVIARSATITPLPALSPADLISSTGAVEPQALQDGNIQLAMTKFQDSKVKPADGEEPIPPPEVPYNGDKPIRAGDGESCECIGDACCPPPRPLFWTSGIEATFLRPDLNEGYGTFSVAEFNGNRFDEFSTSTNDVDDLYMSPRIWLGVQGCLWGANLRYWHLRANEGGFDPTLGSDGEWDGPNCGVPDFGFASCNDLEAYTVDMEITRRVCLHDCWMQFSAGVRHAEIEQGSTLNGTALADDSVLFGFANAHRETRGTGIVLGWYGRKPIFPCSCVHWFYNFHWSAVWGPTETAAETGVLVSLTSTDPDAIAAAGSVNGASTTVDDNMFIGEIQLGLEWDYALRCLPANAFCRVALEYQRWTGGQGYSQANSFAGVAIDGDPTTLGDAFALADSPDLDLVGLAVSTGLTW